MATLREKAIIVDLTISQWGARKMDKKVTKEVEDAHDARRAGTFSKNLIDPVYMQPITQVVNEMRKYHAAQTLPWGEAGERVLPSKNYFEYMTGISDLKRRYDEEVKNFLKKYEDIKDEARNRLKTLFRESEYPSVKALESKFGVEVRYEPIPEHRDFRIEGLGKDEIEQIKAAIEKDVQKRHEEATKDLIGRAHDVLKRIVKVLGSDERTRITDSLMQSVEDLVDIIPMLNYTDDPTVNKLRDDLEAMYVPSDDIRKDESVRNYILARAKELEKFYA